MKTFLRAAASLELCALLFTLQAPAAHAREAPAPATAARDGQHDFDFVAGTWRTHIRNRKHPLSGSSEFAELTGTVTEHKIWDGLGWMEEIEAGGPDGHFKGMTVFLYNPEARQWSQTFADMGAGKFNTPTIGGFKDGRGELYSQDAFEGRTILIRGVWSDIRPDFHRYEEDYSDDGGKTWEPEFQAELTRLKP